jgi:hypothetical protein
MKKRFAGLLLVGAIFSSCAPMAKQDGTSPQALFEKAKAAHGGAALEEIKTYKDNGTLDIFQNGQLAAKAEYVQKYDFTTSVGRIEVSLNGKLAAVQQVSKTDAWQWTPQSGVVKLPTAQAQLLKDGLNQWPFSLRAKASDLTEAKYDGRVELAKGISGDSITFRLNGALNNLVIADNGVALGGKLTEEGVTAISLYGDVRVVNGVKLPFSIKVSSGGQPATNLQTVAATVNPAFAAADFAQPK